MAKNMKLTSKFKTTPKKKKGTTPNHITRVYSIEVVFVYFKVLLDQQKEVIKISPPSAREAVMKHLESFLETTLKHSGNTLENHDTSSKLP